MFWLIAAAAVLVGVCLQRLAGMGTGLVVAPVLSALFGGALGVLMTNMTAIATAVLIIFNIRDRVNWRRGAIIAAWAVPGVLLGALLVYALPTAWLSIIVGTVVLLALANSYTRPHVRERHSPLLTASAGSFGGLLNATSGVAAPVMVLYARATRWEQREFAATLQIIFLTMNVTSVISKSLIGIGGEAFPPIWVIPTALVLVVIGVGTGGLLERRVSPGAARRMAEVLAFIGSIAAIIRGVMGVMGDM